MSHISIGRSTEEEWSAFVIMSHVAHISESCCTRQWVTPHMWMSHGTHMSESWHTYESCLMYHIAGGRRNMCCPKMGESCRTCQWVMSHMWISHVAHMISHFAHMDESCRTHNQSHCTYEEESCRTYECVLPHVSFWCHEVLQCVAVCCSVLQCKHLNSRVAHMIESCCIFEQGSSHLRPHCNTLQHTATHRNTLLTHTWISHVVQVTWHTLQHTATHGNTLQHTATHC